MKKLNKKLVTKKELVTVATLPQKVKIGWRDVALVPVDASFMKDNTDCYGEFLSRESAINIQKEVKGIDLGNTLLHEIMHSIAYYSSLNQANGPLKDDDAEEVVINSMSNWLMGAFKDNPWLLDFIKESLE
ncbi:MAG TPA: hypothetical protein DEO86_13745 [Colwellia sp.]|nr:hypothetical protein [Colwellia sp.]|tara:strand:+ start:9475 stop:9867 length:393 start_codon:yes stop_codon:yes gene_type:complete